MDQKRTRVHMVGVDGKNCDDFWCMHFLDDAQIYIPRKYHGMKSEVEFLENPTGRTGSK